MKLWPSRHKGKSMANKWEREFMQATAAQAASEGRDVGRAMAEARDRFTLGLGFGGGGGNGAGGSLRDQDLAWSGISTVATVHPVERKIYPAPSISASDVIRRSLAGNENYEFSVFCEVFGESATVIVRLHSKSANTTVQFEDPLDKFPSLELLNKLALLR